MVRTKLKMREGCDLDSELAGEISETTKVHILERSELSDGTIRARIARFGEAAPLGWVSLIAKDGRANLVEATAGTPEPTLAPGALS